ncbi:transglutaminase family protein [uncultured Propionivibrio sp.]|uniref:transglutaminase family protein n=1 Tax=uncultured Propionivibrio sp. TaxID=426737 RepID=UPI0029C0D477|nr:transglutaminase family protein [uncultured Propionivibrio sp.]
MDSTRYHVIHETRYDYESPVSLSRQLLHLTPRACPWQRCLAHEIVILPTPGVDRERVDSFGNPVRQFAIEAPHGSLVVRAESRVEVLSRQLDALAFAAPAWESVRDRLTYGVLPVALEASVYLFESPYTRVKREFAAYAAPSFTPGRPLLDAVRDLMRRVFREFRYDAKATTVATPVLTVLEQRRGVCQDFAHLMISCLRSLGLSARYVSGYLLTRPPPGKPRLIGADASHAWVSVFCPDVSGGIWVDFDPTNNVLPDREHITVAWGRDFGDVSPLRGVILGGDAHQPEVAVTVTPCEEA